MDSQRFDELARALAAGASRRDVLRRLVGGGVGGALAVAGVRRAGAQADKVGVCHQTGSASNPYEYIEVSQNAAAAHADHGDVIAPDFANDPTNCGSCGNVCIDDGDVCTVDQCVEGECANTPVDCSALTDECNEGTCDSAAGGCVAVAANEGGTCTAASGEAGICTTGTCVPVDTCAPGGVCATDADCCAVGEVCQGGTCALPSACNLPLMTTGVHSGGGTAGTTQCCDANGNCTQTIQVNLVGSTPGACFDVYIDQESAGDQSDHLLAGSFCTDGSGNAFFTSTIAVGDGASVVDNEIVPQGGEYFDHQYIQESFVPCACV